MPKTAARFSWAASPATGCSFPQTIIIELKNGDPLIDEEQFGPVLPIISYSNVGDAIASASDSQNDLGGSV